MADDPNKRPAWTEEERKGIRNLLKLALTLFTAIILAGIIAATLSSALGTL